MKKIVLAFLFVFAMIFQLAAQDNNSDALLDLFPKQLINRRGKLIDTKMALQGKTVAVYFSASWCGPCRTFTPKLIDFYKRTAKKGNLEIVFVSADKSEKLMMDYMKKNFMPWLAVPFNDPCIAKLKKLNRVRGIPRLMILSSSGKVLSHNGRWDVVLLQKKALDAWLSPDYQPKTYNDWKQSGQRDEEKSRRSKRKSKRRRR